MSEGIDTARRVIAHHSKSFAFAARILPTECRDDTAVVYAWCRYCDDSVDNTEKPEQSKKLAELSQLLDSVYRGDEQADPVMAAFQKVVQRWDIPKSYPLELLTGMNMDASDVRYETLDQLLVYCYRVAGTVGLMMSHVMGLRDPAVLRNAAHLGIAMQLTNICRDVLEDWGLGRLYLPSELFADSPRLALPLTPAPGSKPDLRARPVLAQAIRRLLALADRYYASGDAGLAALSARCSLAVRSARLIYSAIGARVRETGCDPFAGRVFTPTRLKVRLLIVATRAEMALAVKTATVPFKRVDLPELKYPDVVIPVNAQP